MRAVTVFCWVASLSLVHATHGPLNACPCRGTSTTRPRKTDIVSYTIQSETCRNAAVMFLLKSGTTVCSDPEQNWVKKAMEKVDKDKEALLLNEPESTTDIPATTMTVSRKAPRKTSRYRKKRNGKMLTHRMKGSTRRKSKKI